MEPLSLRFVYSRSEYMQATRIHFASRLRLPLDIAVVLVLAILGSYFWKTEDQPNYGFFLIAIEIAFVTFLLLAFTMLPYLVFRNQPSLKDEYNLTFSSEEIQFRTIHLNSTLQWTIYRRALVSSDFYLLYHGPRSFSVVPIRVFANTVEQQKFDQLIQGKISKIDRATWWRWV